MIPTEGSKHCFHAHMHFLPIGIDLNNEIIRDFDESTVEVLSRIFELYKENDKGPYLFVDDKKSMDVYFLQDHSIRRQYLRYKAALLVGKPDLWDWVNNQGWDKIQNALVTLTPYFKSH
jgi:hypothetical protein